MFLCCQNAKNWSRENNSVYSNPWLPSYLFDACFVRVVEGASLYVFRDQLGPNLRNLMPVHQGFQGCKVIGWLAVSCIIQIHGCRTCKWVAGGVKALIGVCSRVSTCLATHPCPQPASKGWLCFSDIQCHFSLLKKGEFHILLLHFRGTT